MTIDCRTSSFIQISLTDGGEYKGADDHEDGLHEVGPDDGRESSGDGEQARDAQQDQDGDVDGVLALDLNGKLLRLTSLIKTVGEMACHARIMLSFYTEQLDRMSRRKLSNS